jgi:acetyltransferase-like isoleucine patch superfamily enzyme
MDHSPIFIHDQADVRTRFIGEGTRIWQFAVVAEGARIGRHCNINCHTFIEGRVLVGDNVTIKSGVFLWDGLVLEDDVFIGPHVTFTNDKYPRSGKHPAAFQQTLLQKGCSLGAGSIILGGLVVGAYAMVAAGSVVTRDVPSHALVMGSPARVCGWVDKDGNKVDHPKSDPR